MQKFRPNAYPTDVLAEAGRGGWMGRPLLGPDFYQGSRQRTGQGRLLSQAMELIKSCEYSLVLGRPEEFVRKADKLLGNENMMRRLAATWKMQNRVAGLLRDWPNHSEPSRAKAEELVGRLREMSGRKASKRERAEKAVAAAAQTPADEFSG